MANWGMVIDLKKCIGGYICRIACKEEHLPVAGRVLNEWAYRKGVKLAKS